MRKEQVTEIMVTNSETIEARPVALTTAEGCKLPIAAIEESAEAAPRESLNAGRIREFALMYGEGMDGRVNLAALPPLDVIHAISDDVYILADGWHRIAALRKLGIVNAWCIVVESEPDRARLSSLPIVTQSPHRRREAGRSPWRKGVRHACV